MLIAFRQPVMAVYSRPPLSDLLLLL